jgi:hypothetical protein
LARICTIFDMSTSIALVERAAHVLGDPASHRRHRLRLLADVELRGRRRGGGCRWRRRSGRLLRRGGGRRRRGRRGRRRRLLLRARLDVVEDVLLGDASAAAAACDLGDVDAVLGRDPRDHGRDEAAAVVAVLAVVGGGLGDGADTLARRGHRLVGGLLCRGLGRRLGRRSRGRALGGDHRQARPDLDRLALLHQDLLHDAGPWRGNLGVDLVGRDLEQRLVGLHRVADLLQPAGDRPLGDGDAHLRHHDVDRGSSGHSLRLSV